MWNDLYNSSKIGSLQYRNSGRRLSGFLNRFRKEEDGAMVALTLFVLLIMLLIGGIGIDLMRHERNRALLSTIADSASLAAANSSDEATAKAIAEDYFDKMGASAYLHEIQDEDITITLNSAEVNLDASVTLDTFLMKLAGVETLTANTASTAEKRIPKLEISLVLDVSGSMQGSKIANLKVAAKEFVTTILNSADPGDATISLIPFSFSVTPNQSVYESLTVNETHSYSTCLRFSDSDFNATAINPSTAYDQQIYTANYGNNFGDHAGNVWRGCYDDEYFQIMPYSISESALYAKIDSLQADGNTSGDMGIKWGAALIDPSFAPVLTAMQAPQVTIDENTGATTTFYEVDPSLSNLPSSYTEPDTLKVIIMMGDGANTSSYFFPDNSAYRGPNSDLFNVVATQQVFVYAYDIYNPSRQWNQAWAESYCYLSWLECVYEASGTPVSAYYLRKPSNNTYYDIENDNWLTASEFQDLDNEPGFVSKDRLDWETAWGLMTPEFYKNKTGIWTPYNEYNSSSNAVTGLEKDGRMDSICTATKANGVIVYTIGFEITSGGRAEGELLNCASSVNHYYPTNGAGISEAFASIASNVQNLRLTQ